MGPLPSCNNGTADDLIEGDWFTLQAGCKLRKVDCFKVVTVEEGLFVGSVFGKLDGTTVGKTEGLLYGYKLGLFDGCELS